MLEIGAGWPNYEIRKITGQLPKRKLRGEAWDGQPYPGKRLLIATEQGFGGHGGGEVTIMKGLGHFPMSENRPESMKHLLPVLEKISVR